MADIITPSPITVPFVNGSYTDPAFGTKVTRVTSALKWTAPDYSTWCPWNADGTKFLLVNVDHFDLYFYLSGITGLIQPLPIGASCDSRWSTTDPRLIYFVQGNTLNLLNISTGSSLPLRVFPEYTQIRIGNGEGDISYDGNYFALVGTRLDGGIEVFVYDIKANTKGAVLDCGGRPLDAVYMAPGGVLVKWTDAIGFRGLDMTPLRPILSCDGHGAVGSDNCLYITNSNENPVTLPDFPNGIVRIDLATGKQTGLLALVWSLAVDIAACAPGVILVSTYSASGGPWVPYRNELLLLATDGSSVKRLAHTRSSGNPSWSSDDNYLVQPHAQISRDGTKILWGSNMAHLDQSGRCDTYLIDLGATVPIPHQRPPRPPQPNPGHGADGGGAIRDKGESEDHRLTERGRIGSTAMPFLHLGVYREDAEAPKREAIEAVLNKAKDWYRYAPNCWLIYTARSPAYWCEKLREISGMDGHASFLVCELPIDKKDKRAGWLQVSVWEWINKSRSWPARRTSHSVDLSQEILS